MVLTRYQASTAGSLKPLLGSWVGKIQPNPAISVTAVFRFETTKEGKIVGFLDVPDQGAKDLAVSDLALDNGQVSFKIPAAKIDYAGKLTGSTISGTFKQAGMETKLDLVRGKYVPPAPEVNIAAETMKQLLGRWSGKLKVNETVSLTVVVRFEQNAEGKIVVLMDSPDQNAKDIPVSSAAFADGKLLLKIARVMGEYTGALGDKKIEGTFTQMGKPLPLVLTKE